MKCEHIRDYSLGSRILSANTNEYMWKCSKCGHYDSDRVGSSIISLETVSLREALMERQGNVKKWT